MLKVIVSCSPTLKIRYVGLFTCYLTTLHTSPSGSSELIPDIVWNQSRIGLRALEQLSSNLYIMFPFNYFLFFSGQNKSERELPQCHSQQSNPANTLKATQAPTASDDIQSPENKLEAETQCLQHSPMVQIMLVLRAVIGSWSMSSRQRCSRKVSAMLASSCWRWMKESGSVIASE